MLIEKKELSTICLGHFQLFCMKMNQKCKLYMFWYMLDIIEKTTLQMSTVFCLDHLKFMRRKCSPEMSTMIVWHSWQLSWYMIYGSIGAKHSLEAKLRMRRFTTNLDIVDPSTRLQQTYRTLNSQEFDHRITTYNLHKGLVCLHKCQKK
jgi:hypothetical protein